MSDEKAAGRVEVLTLEGAEIRKLQATVWHLERLVMDADTVARTRGDAFGLYDAIDNAGNPYQSQWAHDIIEPIRFRRTLGSPDAFNEVFGHPERTDD